MAANGVLLQPNFFAQDDDTPAVGMDRQSAKFGGGYS
jgi:hypothetical protein